MHKGFWWELQFMDRKLQTRLGCMHYAFVVCQFARFIHITNFWFWFLQEESIKIKVHYKRGTHIEEELNFWITKEETERMMHMILIFIYSFVVKCYYFHLLDILMLVTPIIYCKMIPGYASHISSNCLCYNLFYLF